MNDLRLSVRMGFWILRSRPTLTILAVGLLAAAVTVGSGLIGTAHLLRTLQADLLLGLTVDVEFERETADRDRDSVAAVARQWPGCKSVQFVSPEETFQRLEEETGEDLLELFGENPFPPMLRLGFSAEDIGDVDSLMTAAQRWKGVTAVVYPKRLWDRLAMLLAKTRGTMAYIAVLICLAAVSLVGLCLRAQVRGRADTWELLALLGMSDRSLAMSLLVQEAVVGLLAGLLVIILLVLLAAVYSWLLVQPVSFPVWFYLTSCLSAVALSVIAGALTPRQVV